MPYVSLARFTLKDDPGVGQSWQLPASVTASIDLTPPALDSVVDDNPLTNHAICLSDSPLDSNDSHYNFGTGNVTEMQMTGADRNAWQAITGYLPQAGTVAECIAEHLLRSPGQERVNPLTCGFNRGLEVHLGGKIWDHTLTELNDPLALPVLRMEAESLAKIYHEQGETQYRLSMGGVRRWYSTRPIKELIQYLFPAGRDDLPLLDELTPQTVITETFPSTGDITTGQDNTWTMVVGVNTIQVSPAGTLTQNASASASEYTALLGYTFGGSNRSATYVQGVTTNSGGVFTRSDATLGNAYFCGNSRLDLVHYKRVGGTYTRLVTMTSAVVAGNTVFASVAGSTLVLKVNGVQIDSRTDTAVASGTRSGVRIFQNALTAGLIGPLVIDDLISGGSGASSWYYLAQQAVANL